MPWEWIGLAAAIIQTNWNRMVPNWTQGPNSGYIPTDFPDESVQLVPVGVMNAYFMYRISSLQSFFEPLRFSFGELLTLTRHFKCEDKRDKIFGLLGLPTTDDDRGGMLADFAHCLADGRLGWALKPDAFGSMSDTTGQGQSDIAIGSDYHDPRNLNDDTSLSSAEDFPGDKVCVIYGTPVPFIIRRCEGKQGYRLVGECYIDDIMHGEAFDNPRYEEAWIDLV
ncbi:hypothetical protein N658DRAFT_506685 [Parathielavia hyrcaniae]|uniref:Uncharacterized protein n=1 Tax=Parathielavia hyrcaniae TaxID=113614 RepID=A0AAN6Q1P7_9PEZI|nr:hypothetical protein N658DRAFT_506685 [Parathielavia hyrcaniae]